MAITATQRNEVISLLVGMFDAAPSAELMTLFVKQIEGGKTITQLANDMAVTTEFESLYPAWLTDSEFASNFAETILDGHTSSELLAVAVSVLTDVLAGGATRGEAAQVAVNFLSTVDVTDPDFGEAGQAFQNKTDVATYFATNLLDASSDMASLQAVVANIDETQESVDAQKALIDLGVTSVDDFDQVLTIGQDNITGTAGDDMFAAWIFDNQNSAQSGDVINGGLGTDTLMAEIGNSQAFAISLKTTSVEVAMFRAQAQSTDGSDNDIDDDDGDEGIDQQQQIDAEDMLGTEQFWSYSARANLTIEDIQRNSHETTIGWRNSDSGNVNYEVYFDNITAPGSTTAGSQLFLELLDLDGMRTDGEPLLDNPYVGFSFQFGTETINLAGDQPLNGEGATFAQLAEGFNALLAEAGLDTVTATLGSTFSAINSKNGVAYEGTTIVLTNSGPEVLTAIGWLVDGVLPPDSNIHTSIDDQPPATSDTLTQTDVVFDYVGSGSKSAIFVAGEISQGTHSGSQGIQQFNVVVDRSSNMEEIRSTNNSLEEVYVESTGANGTLQIDLIEDVRVFDASAMQNSVILGATIGPDDGDPAELKSLFDKYVNLEDTAANETADNVVFEYTLTGSADVLTMEVAQEAVSYEDFVLEIETGNGNDTVFFQVNSTDATLDTNWNADQAALNNLFISTGAGDDTVTTFGSGEVTIATASGADTVYSDNSGINNEAATWVFNATGAAPDINDILGNGSAAGYYLEGATLTVTFSAGSTGGGLTVGNADALANGFENTVSIATTLGVATAADISQAIKAAINDDAVLSKLLLAEDGPNHSIIVTSLIDGVFQAGDLDIEVLEGAFATLNTTANQSNYHDLNNDSTTDFTAALLADEAEALVAAYTGIDFDNARGNGTADQNNQVLAADGAFTAATFDVDTVTIVADGADSGEETVTITYDSNGATAGGGVPVVVVLGGVDATDAAAVATLVRAALNADGGFAAVANAAGAGADVVITYNHTNGANGAAAAAAGGTVTTFAANLVNTVAGQAGTLLDGVASDEGQNDNIINLGAGDDVLVLSTDVNSEENVVITDSSFGVNTIVNFTVGAGAGADNLDFSNFLNDILSASGSTESQARAALDVDVAVALGGGTAVGANSITTIDAFTQDVAGGATETWANLDGAAFLAAINGTTAGGYGTAALVDATLDVAATQATLVGSTRNHIVMVENDLNDGEYKVFLLTDGNTGANGAAEFASSSLLGVIDLGETGTGLVAGDFI